MKPHLLITGNKGLIGSKIIQLLENNYSFHCLDISDPISPVDITDESSVSHFIEKNPESKTLIHLAAFTDVTQAWKQTNDKDGLAYKVNVLGTKNLVNVCKKMDIHLIHVSTAYVFDGEKIGLYEEDDAINPIEWYGQTKAWAEEEITKSEADYTILRIDQPFRDDSFFKLDIIHNLINQLKESTLPPMFFNHYIGPTYINDFVKVIEYVANQRILGTFHASNGESWSNYDLAKLVKETFLLSGNVASSDLLEYLKTNTRPYQKNTAMSNEKITRALPFKLHSITEAVKAVKT